MWPCGGSELRASPTSGLGYVGLKYGDSSPVVTPTQIVRYPVDRQPAQRSRVR
jgi:hypothetical protein